MICQKGAVIPLGIFIYFPPSPICLKNIVHMSLYITRDYYTCGSYYKSSSLVKNLFHELCKLDDLGLCKVSYSLRKVQEMQNLNITNVICYLSYKC